jgi:hypothetical protein
MFDRAIGAPDNTVVTVFGLQLSADKLLHDRSQTAVARSTLTIDWFDVCIKFAHSASDARNSIDFMHGAVA